MSSALSLLERALAGDRRALSRCLSWIEDRRPGALELVSGLRPRRRQGPGLPAVVGLTGPPGAGKSTFTSRLVTRARSRGQRVAVLAVDPSSPFSGGAILGDRLRMEEHALDAGVYVRSLASRGQLGGLSRATGMGVDLLDAAGFDLILVETVGVGQSELGVMEVADTVLVVLTPESGDTVQTMKAGLLEVADAFVVNKADRSGADRLARELEWMVQLEGGGERGAWTPPVRCAAAALDQGVEEVGELVEQHLTWCQDAGLDHWRARRGLGRLRTFLDLISEGARDRARGWLEGPGRERALALEAGTADPYAEAAAWSG